MPQFATVKGHVTYVPGDGTPLPIPKGRIEVVLAPDSATLSWEAEKGVVGLTAIPRMTYDEYVEQGKIVPEA
ncbi:MAG: hypothetical protein ABWZ88_16090 [Variovorax sp.]